ncbi:MAG: alkaline phosphatase [Flavobacteriaceae bacterium]|nr:alkaline phosphatase [Flavobacteriaceae bacterium]
MRTKYYFLLILSLIFVSATTFAQTQKRVKKPKNIILLIGDGTGLSQVSAAQYFKEGAVNYERFPVVGLIKTSSSSDLITDSAAGATAFANGVKTYNGAIGLDKDSLKVKNIVAFTSQKGMNTGIIATSSITHATPACFYAHSKSRNFHEEIASFLPNSEIDFFAGAGLQYFNKRKDGKNLLSDFQKNGFTIDTVALAEKKDKKIGFLLAEKSMPKMVEERGDFLPKATQLAINFLSKDNKNFFLMVEGSQIDWGGHDNDAAYLISELIDFDNTLGTAIDFAEENGETLVIVTADHETGGFTLASNGENYNEIVPSFSTKGHSATMVPVFAFGPGAELFGGIYENTQIFHKILSLLSE